MLEIKTRCFSYITDRQINLIHECFFKL